MGTRKQQFIDWVASDKLKKVTPKQFADLMEDAFSLYLGRDVWSVDAKEFAVLRDRLLTNKNFKKKQKKTHKAFTLYCKYYLLFLSMASDEQDGKLQTAHVEEEKESDAVEEKYIDEQARCIDFFQNKDVAHLFYRIFEYAKDSDANIFLDIRSAIIGAKKANERLRFYADKNGIMKFAKIEVEAIDLSSAYAFDLSKYYQYVDAVNAYFLAHEQEILLEGDEKSYVYHKSFGFGRIVKKEKETIIVQFDGQPDQKTMQAGHPSYIEISDEDYARRTVPDFASNNEAEQPQSRVTERVTPRRIVWDKYETVLLIEAFWKIEGDKTLRSGVIEQLSRDLRAKAQNQGIEIDDTFRNINGISIQMANLASSFYPDRASMHKTAIFDEMAKLYLQNRQEYEAILREAHALVKGTLQSQKVKSVNWQAIKNMSFTSPTKVNYKDNSREGFSNWIECYKYVVKAMYDEFAGIFNELAKNPSYTFLSYNRTDLRRPLEIVNHIYAEGNRSATELVKSMKSFMDKCEIHYSSLIIEYEEKDGTDTLPKVAEKTHYSVSISEADFYTYIKTQYMERHQVDGKKHRAPHHAQKCVDMIREISSLLNKDILSVVTTSELDDIRRQLKPYEKDEKYEWFLYALSRYEGFLKSNHADLGLNSQSIKAVEPKAEDYKVVIEDSFSDGFAFENPLRKRKFIRRYEEILNKPFEDSDELFLRKVRIAGFISEGKVYLESIVPKELRNEIKKYIDESFDSTSAIYYSALYEKFSSKFNSLFSEDMLKSYFAFVFADEYSYYLDFMTPKGIQANLREELISIFMNKGRPMDIDELYDALPNAAHSVIDAMIRDRDFVVNYRGRSYFYKDVFILDEEQLSMIDEFLARRLSVVEQVSGGELYGYIAKEIPEVLETNPGVTDLGIKNIIRIKLEHKYSFRGDVISRLGFVVDVKSLYRGFCEQREKFSFAELEEFRNSIDKNYIDWDAVMSSSVRTSQSSFIRRDLITFKAEQIDEAIASYCLNKYVPFADIINYTDFPTIEVNWNAFVLESYVYFGSKKYGLIHASFNGDKPVGAIVKKDSDIHGFDDLLIDIIKEHKLFDEERAFEYLLANDYIRTRKVKNMLALIEQAKKEV